MTLNQISGIIIEKSIEVHRHLGPGLLESAYQGCLAFELKRCGLLVECEKSIPVVYKGVKLNCGYRIDLFVEDLIIVEIKSVERLAPIHTAQVLTYLRLLDRPLGLLINFNVDLLKRGIKRVIN